MARIAEFLHGVVDFTRRECFGIHKVDQKISGAVTGDFGLLVAFNPIAHVIPMRDDTPNSIGKDTGKVRHDVRGVTTSQLDIRREAKVFANHHAIANANRSGKGFVVSVPKT